MAKRNIMIAPVSAGSRRHGVDDDELDCAAMARDPSVKGSHSTTRRENRRYALGARARARLGRRDLRRLSKGLNEARRGGRRFNRSGEGNAKGKRKDACSRAATSQSAGHRAARMVGLPMAFPGRGIANEGAPERAEDNIFGGKRCRVGGGREGEEGGLEQKRPDHDQGNAILISAQPAHGVCCSPVLALSKLQPWAALSHWHYKAPGIRSPSPTGERRC